MAHEIDMSNNRANMAFTGRRSKIWHGLGSELTPGSSIETWQKESGMNWEVERTQVMFQPNMLFTPKKFADREVLYRSDTLKELSIVSDDFKIVQPSEVLEFFRDLTEVHGMTLSTAGCLFGGKRFWALAETNMNDAVVPGDEIKGYLLFITSVDGTLSSQAKFVSERVVCNNTLTIALNEKTSKVVRKTHRSVWDSTQAKIDLGLLSSNWEGFMSDLRLLANREMSDKEVKLFFKKTFFDPNKDDSEQGWGANRKVFDLMNIYTAGAGSHFSYGTAYGALNAVTDYFTHGRGQERSSDSKFMKGYYGNDSIKNNVFQSLVELC